MGTRDEVKSNTLKIMRNWRWFSGDPDGNIWPQYMDVCEAVNRLAMAGIPSPQFILLDLLCEGTLVANGSYKWRKYQWGSHFQHEEYESQLDQRQWQILAEQIADMERELANHGWPMDTVDLEKLELSDCPKYEWVFANSRFSTALCPPDTLVQAKDYYEEWFSAWDIRIHYETHSWIDEPEASPEPISPPNRGGRPLAEWWPDFVAELVAYVVEEGLPHGIGHQGQSEVFRIVSERLQERGKTEPSRSQIQEVVNAVLRRMRQPET